ncbi:hypothetical protein [Amycolatopsis sp. CA-230715]|uniref:hypothetical protein n=1 Tax=Amycolatopsis sp. CA-230715 TaxID=2745196 RepID=UPI001C00C9AD|nr:hypothetical protein [Amycolatopsis sp. CA-230715]QWF77804.1 hypothetical protein HUW46_01197 [Amycolatopsis sp. CA-230715]
MSDHLLVAAPGARFTTSTVPITGDRLIHPRDVPNDLARIVVRWARTWLPYTAAARDHFDRLERSLGTRTRYADSEVLGWLFLTPEDGSLAAKVRSGEIEAATALCAESEAWPS